MSRLLKGLFGATLVSGLIALGVWAFLAGRRELAHEREMEQPVKVPPRVSQLAGETVVTLDRPTQERIALKIQPLVATTLQPEATAYGRLQGDPAESFTLRAPLAGTLRRTASNPWPGIGQVLKNGSVIGSLEPRLSPVDRVDLAARLATARGDERAALAALEAARASFQRKKGLNAAGKIVSDQDMQAAEAQVKTEEARQQAATETVHLIESAFTATTAPAGATEPIPLIVSTAGQVVELMAQPGETVESGQAILHIGRFDRLLARVDLPAGESVPEPISAARIIPLGHEHHPFPGERVMMGPAVDPRTQGQSFVFRIQAAEVGLRPGLAVSAYIAAGGEPQKGVVIPRAAVVQFNGREWVYVQRDPEKFARQMVTLDRPTEDGWFATAGFAPNAQIVVAGAQMLLSEELKSQIQIGEEGESGK